MKRRLVREYIEKNHPSLQRMPTVQSMTTGIIGEAVKETLIPSSNLAMRLVAIAQALGDTLW